MKQGMNQRLTVSVRGRGLYDVTHKVTELVTSSGLLEGLATLFLRHTSASLLIQENADPAVRHDLERWLERLVPEGDVLYTHLTEGPDDMPAHLKTALTAVSLSIPVMDGQLVLGTWQGIYLWEHRRKPGERQIVVNLLPC